MVASPCLMEHSIALLNRWARIRGYGRQSSSRTLDDAERRVLALPSTLEAVRTWAHHPLIPGLGHVPRRPPSLRPWPACTPGLMSREIGSISALDTNQTLLQRAGMVSKYVGLGMRLEPADHPSPFYPSTPPPHMSHDDPPQACLCIRNIAARGPSLRQSMLDDGCEAVLRDAGKVAGCVDEAYMALRDLRCEVRRSCGIVMSHS